MPTRIIVKSVICLINKNRIVNIINSFDDIRKNNWIVIICSLSQSKKRKKKKLLLQSKSQSLPLRKCSTDNYLILFLLSLK